MSKENISQNKIILDRLILALDKSGLPKHGRGVILTKCTGYSSGQLSAILNNKVSLNERFIKSVCKEYSINEIWVGTGEGEMFNQVMLHTSSCGIVVGGSATVETTSAAVDPSAMTLEQKLDWIGFGKRDKRFILEFAKLTEEEQEVELKRLLLDNIDKGRY